MMVDSPFGPGFLAPTPQDFGAKPTEQVQRPGNATRSNGRQPIAQAVTVSAATWLLSCLAAEASAPVPVQAVIVPLGPQEAVAESSHATGSTTVDAEQASLPAIVARWSEAHLEDLAKREPGQFLDLLSSGQLEPVLLTYGAEYVGQLAASPQALAVLEQLLGHPKSYVREGALLGLAGLGTPPAVAQLRQAANADPSPSIRAIATELCQHFEA